MSSEPPELVEETTLDQLFLQLRKDTAGWVEAFNDHGMHTLHDLMLCDVDDVIEIFKDKNLEYNRGTRNALKFVIRSQPGVSPTWNFGVSSTPGNVTTSSPSGNQSRSGSGVGSLSSKKSTKFLYNREPGYGLKHPICPAVVVTFARLLGFLTLLDSDINTICYLMCLYHGLGVALTPANFEIKAMALALSRLFGQQTLKRNISWTTKLYSFFKNFRQGRYPKENPFPDCQAWFTFLTG